MGSSKLLIPILSLQLLFTTFSLTQSYPQANPKLFREYIGAEFVNITFSNVPIDDKIEVHFLLSFAIDYTTSPSSPSPTPTNGDFNIFWDQEYLSPSQVSLVKAKHPNVKVGLSLGGDTVAGKFAYFNPQSINSWVTNAIHSITRIVRVYNLDAIDIDYEHFSTDPETFAECIGRLLFFLKQNQIVNITSIAPYDDDAVQPYYFALWRKYGHLIDYVNFQFYAYDKGTTVSQFMAYFATQLSNYDGSRMLVSFGTDKSGGLKPQNGFFTACTKINQLGKLHGIFVWSADDSKKDGFRYEKISQDFLFSAK